jgi:hypothetical protein
VISGPEKLRLCGLRTHQTFTVWGVAEIIYSYSHNGKYFSGTHKKQFISYDSANRYIGGFPKDAQIVVRVKPEHPKTSFLRDDDQDQVALKLKTRFE